MVLVYRSVVSVYRNLTRGMHTVSSPHEELEARLRAKILEVDETDGGARIIVYHDPRSHRVGGREVAPSDVSITYTKQNEFGEVIESTQADGVNLLLPRMAVRVGSTWREIERYVPPWATETMELIRVYHVASIIGNEVEIHFQTEPMEYSGETSSGNATECSLSAKAKYYFDTQWGVVTRQNLETTMTSREVESTFQVRSEYTLELVDD